MAVARDSPRSARHRPRRLGMCQTWLLHVGVVGGVGHHDVRRRERRGRGPPPARRQGLRACHDSMKDGRGSDAALPSGAFRRMPIQSEGQGVAAWHRVGRLGTVRFAKGGLDSPRRIDADAGQQWQASADADVKRGSVSRASCLSCDSFLLESRSAPHGASVGRSWRWPRCCPRRRSCPSPGRRGWC